MTIQRFNRINRCPICGGYDKGSGRGRGERCFGFISSDSKYAHCTREEHAGALPCITKSHTYAHKLIGECKCGSMHGQSTKLTIPRNARARVEKIYSYRQEDGGTLFEVVRSTPKGFKQRRPDGRGGHIWNLAGVRRVLYCLPDLLAADPQQDVFIAEGEKDVDRLRDFGLVATTNAGGAGNWRGEYAEFLRGRSVVLLPDNDDKGSAHAEDVARSVRLLAASIKVVKLPDLPERGDISDWLDAGGTVEQLRALVAQTPLWQPQANAPVEDKVVSVSRERRSSQATRLCDLTIAAGVELFHTPDGKAYATVRIDDHRETMLLKSRGFREWLSYEYFKIEGTTPNTQSLNDVVNTLSGHARFKGACVEVHTRIAQLDDAIYLDLCNEEWRAVEINRDGWRVIEAHECPVKFRRTRGMLPLPEPVRGSSLDALWNIINVDKDAHVLIAAYLVAALRPGRPFPALALHGEQGSAKSTTARIIRSLVDPNVAALRSEPRDVRDLMIASSNGWIVAFDNLSHIPSWLSDALCRLSTGGGFATRELYSDGEEVLFDAMRPCIFTGIEELATRSDLLDRTLIVYLPTIPAEKRRTERSLMPEFEAQRAGILGVLLDGVSAALRNQEQIKLERIPRMADFALWSVAAEEALGFESGTFIEAYSGNLRDINALALEAAPIAAVVRAFMEKQGDWAGTATELLDKLLPHAEESVRRQPSYPKKGNQLSNALRRLAPNLRESGITVFFHRDGDKKRRRLVTLSCSKTGNSPSAPSASSCDSLNRPSTVDMAADTNRTVGETACYVDKLLQRKTSSNSADDVDDADDELSDLYLNDELLERAAIMEFDGGMLREEADKAARLSGDDDLPF